MLIIGHRADAVSAIAILNLSLLQSIAFSVQTTLLSNVDCSVAWFRRTCTRPCCIRNLHAPLLLS